MRRLLTGCAIAGALIALLVFAWALSPARRDAEGGRKDGILLVEVDSVSVRVGGIERIRLRYDTALKGFCLPESDWHFDHPDTVTNIVRSDPRRSVVVRVGRNVASEVFRPVLQAVAEAGVERVRMELDSETVDDVELRRRLATDTSYGYLPAELDSNVILVMGAQGTRIVRHREEVPRSEECWGIDPMPPESAVQTLEQAHCDGCGKPIELYVGIWTNSVSFSSYFGVLKRLKESLPLKRRFGEIRLNASFWSGTREYIDCGPRCRVGCDGKIVWETQPIQVPIREPIQPYDAEFHVRSIAKNAPGRDPEKKVP